MQFDSLNAGDMAHAIQLAVAPVFLLSGIGVFLGLLTNRLARVIDRARKLEDALAAEQVDEREEKVSALRSLARRARYINRSIALSTVAALLVSTVVVLLFSSAALELDVGLAVALLFVAAMLSFIGALVCFLLEVRVAVNALKFRKW